MPNGTSDVFSLSKLALAGLLRSLMPDEEVGVIVSAKPEVGGFSDPNPPPVVTRVTSSAMLTMIEASAWVTASVNEQDATFYIVQLGPRLPTWIIVTDSSALFAPLRKLHHALHEES